MISNMQTFWIDGFYIIHYIDNLWNENMNQDCGQFKRWGTARLHFYIFIA